MNFSQIIRSSARGRLALVGGLLGAALLVALFALYFAILHKPYEVLFSRVRPTDAALIVAELEKKKISYRLDDQGATILAPSEAIDRTRLAILAEDLPLKGGVGFELFNKSDMGLTEFAQKINYQRALQGELARTVTSMDGVDAARVHLSIPEPTIFRDDHRPGKASVTIAMRQGAVMSASMVDGIQRVVASAVPSLRKEDVVVLDQSGVVQAVAANSMNMSEAGAQKARVHAKASVESYYRSLVEQVVGHIYPDAQVTVDASLTLAWQEAPAQQWPPTAREFPLHVSITTVHAGDVRQDEVSDLVRRVLLLSPERGDTLTITPGVGKKPSDVSAEAIPGTSVSFAENGTGPVTEATQTEPPRTKPLPVWGILVSTLVAAGGALTIAVYSLLRRRSWSEKKRRNYTERLKRALGEMNDDARLSA